MTLAVETVATVLERELASTIERWMQRVDQVPELTKIPLSAQERVGHLPQVIEDLITRLRLEKNKQMPETASAHDHGKVTVQSGLLRPNAGGRVTAAASQHL